LNGGVAGLEHEPSSKTSSQRTQDEQIKAIVEAMLHTTPDDATHWSSQTLAARLRDRRWKFVARCRFGCLRRRSHRLIRPVM
jgi:hypothetical protein